MIRFSRRGHNLVQFHVIKITYPMKISSCLLNKVIVITFADKFFRNYTKPGFL